MIWILVQKLHQCDTSNDKNKDQCHALEFVLWNEGQNPPTNVSAKDANDEKEGHIFKVMVMDVSILKIDERACEINHEINRCRSGNNTLFSRLKAAMVSPRMAPPVPSNPAVKPDSVPPIIEFCL